MKPLPPEVTNWINQFVEKDNHGKRLRQMQRAADCDKAVREIMKARPGLSYHQAWDVAKSANPGLFRSEAEQAPEPAKARASQCDRVVKAVQAANPGTSYDEAWQLARAERADLFGG